MAGLTILAANNANSTLASSINTTALSLTVSAGQGALFPSPAANQYFLLTLNDAATGLLTEIVRVTARSGDTMTIVRAQEGTAAQNWSAGDIATNMFTAGTLSALVQATQLQANQFNYAVDTGTANNYSVTLSPAPTALTDGQIVGFKALNGNTGASTLAVNGLAAVPIVGQAFNALSGGEIAATGDVYVQYNSSVGSGSFVVLASAGGLQGVGQTTVALTGSNVTLTPAQYGSPVIVLTGTLTAAVNVIFPAFKGQWLIINNCTVGAYSVTCKTTAGTGVLVSGSGGSQEVYGDGTNLVAQIGNALTPLNVGFPATGNQAQPAFSAPGIIGGVRNSKIRITSPIQSLTMSIEQAIIGSGGLNGIMIRLANLSLSLNLTTTGAGGMDIGSPPANGAVSIYLIYNPTNGFANLLASNASTSSGTMYSGVNMPSGYTYNVLVSVWMTNGAGQLYPGNQVDRLINRAAVSVLSTTTAGGPTSLSISGAVPPQAIECGGYMVSSVVTGAPGGCALLLNSDANSTGLQYNQGFVQANGQTMNTSFSGLIIPVPQTIYYATGGVQGTTYSWSAYITSYRF
jgi:hypothetical protein